MIRSPTKKHAALKNGVFKAPQGFSLIELAIALIVLSLVGTGILYAMVSQRQNRDEALAREQLQLSLESIYAFAMSHGRLPCPAEATLDQSHANAGLENCSLQHGVLPWVSLSVPQTDPWGQRLTYFASSKFSALPVSGARAGFSLATGIDPDNTQLADIFQSTTGSSKAAIEIAAVLVSHGSNGAGGFRESGIKNPIGSTDENENSDADLSFVDHLPAPDYDDQLRWISPHLLKAKLVSAGKLP